MRKLYLIRHAIPEFPGDDRVCMGLTDLPLGKLGKLQAAMLGEDFKKAHFTKVYSSYLARAVETASYLSDELEVVMGLEQMDAGDWDGMPVSEIREKYPELYERRARDPAALIPGAEDIYSGQQRFYDTVRDIMEFSDGDVAIVGHAALIQSFLCKVSGSDISRSRENIMDFCSHATLGYDGDFHIEKMNVAPGKKLKPELCIKLLKALELPERVIRHSRAVRDEAVMIALELSKCGIETDIDLIENAALLHDICRPEPKHSEAGAELIGKLGFPEIADIIEQHHELRSTEINEASLVYLADKLVKEDHKISLDERFQMSALKCKDDEARTAHARRYAQARELLDKVEALTGASLPL